MTIAIMAILAVAAVKTYNKSVKENPEQTHGKVHGIRQSTAVVLAIGEAIWAVLDALISLTRSRQSTVGGGAFTGRSSGFGQRIAADVPAEG